MNLFESGVYGQPRKILRFLAEQGPQPNLAAIARAIGDSTVETLGHWRYLEQQGLVHRLSAGQRITYALAKRLVTEETEHDLAGQYKRQPQKPRKQAKGGEHLSAILEFLESFHGKEFRALEVAEGTGLGDVLTVTNVTEVMQRMSRNELIKSRYESSKIIWFASADSPGLTEVRHYLRTCADQWRRTGAIACGIQRPVEQVSMVVRILHHRGEIDKQTKNNDRSCWWRWKDE